MILSHHEQNDINQNFQKFTYKVQLAYVCSFGCVMSHMSRHFNSKLQLYKFMRNDQKV